MEEDKLTVYTYGLEPGEIDRWRTSYALNPIGLEAEALDKLPAGEPIVVHSRQAAELTRIVEERGLTNDVILYRPTGEDIPVGAYYETAITASQLPRLKELLLHPQQLRIAQMAESVPLRLLAKPVQSLDLQQLGLPQRDAIHIATCLTCPDLLRTALRERIRLYQQLACPPPEKLIEYAIGLRANRELAEHIKQCPLCDAQLSALADVLVPGKALSGADQPVNYARKVIIEVDLTNKPIKLPTDRVINTRRNAQFEGDGLRAAFGALYDVLLAVKRGAGRRQVAEARSWDTSIEPETEVQALLQNAYGSQTPISLNLTEQTLDLGWDSMANAPYLSMPSQTSNINSDFSAELRDASSGDLIWSAMSENNRLVMPPAAIERAKQDYQRGLGQPAGEDRTYTLAILHENI